MEELNGFLYKMMHCGHDFIKKGLEFKLIEIIQGSTNRICPNCGSLLWLKINTRGEIEEVKNVSLVEKLENFLYRMICCDHDFIKKELEFELKEIVQGEAKRICPDCGSLLWLKINTRGEIEEVKNVTLFNIYRTYIKLTEDIC